MAKKKTAAKKKATRNLGGRPLKYTPAQAQKLIDKYFKECDDTGAPYTISNLALALDTNRQTLCNWAERDDELGAIVRRAKWKVEAAVELMLFQAKNPAGPIFWLKNFDWSDRQQLEVSGNVDVMERLKKGRDRVAKHGSKN